jgi:hypothetical protein
MTEFWGISSPQNLQGDCGVGGGSWTESGTVWIGGAHRCWTFPVFRQTGHRRPLAVWTGSVKLPQNGHFWDAMLANRQRIWARADFQSTTLTPT